MTIMIASKRDGFRRCGIAHSSQSTFYPDDFFTEEQLKALSKEPQLVLAYVEDEFDQVQDRRDENLQEADLQKTSAAAQNAQSQAPETKSTALGDALVPFGSVPVVGGGFGFDSPGSGPTSLVIKQDKGPLNAADIELDGLWEEAHLEDMAREAAKAEAAKPPAKTRKPKGTEDKGK
ncbi:hypothetical protein AO268_23570 [Pseudomonas sp. ICMP 8385]|uniref:HI1506-related protein n=1 Tax=Pseudomonas sp. ICMP 8385 TaxID=1718920 RepID=UPI000C078CBB|nr:HI1506-related protein [Pseudomonas sp. ICMP 8385]PHN53946.1 hypothetical protein AO268_23570 [Pseudomonas sp. ICMP 8385]